MSSGVYETRGAFFMQSISANGEKSITILTEKTALAKSDKLSGVSLTRLFFMSIGITDIHRRRGDLYGKRCGTWGPSSVHVLWIKEVKTWHGERG